MLFIMKQKNRVYTLETKMEAIRLKNEGHSVKEIQQLLDIKSESQVYTWWYWYRDGCIERLSQPIGKQYTYGKGPVGKTTEETLLLQNKILKRQVQLLKKYEKMERMWYQNYSSR